jgi:hypothetical protein
MPCGHTFKRYLPAIFTISLYGSLQLAFAANEMPKLSRSTFNLGDRLTETKIVLDLPSPRNGVNTLKFGKNFASELSTLVKTFISFFSVQNEAMGSNNAQKNNDNTNGPCDIFRKNVVQNCPILLGLIFILYIILFT